ncbi:MAG: 2-C-methyl-D-erythritol 4-phosphate cytidylyltransferase, partial [Candidatus Obscuribacterales bacterium]|nr:2-C-methyl-D-erythritol 4-phosphate cytidylyltransferase [Candidatus Obscuribacterales bacterium]
MTTQSPATRVAAIIAAGGIGSRFSQGGQKKHKQCFILKGHPLYMWCLGSFCNHPQVGRIILVSHEDVRPQIEKEIFEYRRARAQDDGTSIEVIGGGETRQESVYKGLVHLSEIGERPDFVLVHDAARPFLTEKLINDTISSVIEHGACTVAIPVSDTVKRVA